MRPKLLSKVKVGDRLTVRRWNEFVDAINRCNIDLGQDSGLDAIYTPTGVILRAAGDRGKYLAVANGNITKRVGTTAGSGDVYLVGVNGTTLTTSAISIAVINPSSTAMTSGNGIDSGMYCWIEREGGGNWVVSPLECS